MAGTGVVFDELSFLQHDGRSGHRRSAPRRGKGCGGYGSHAAWCWRIRDAAKRGRRHARGQLEQPVIRSAIDLFRATAWRMVPDLVSGPARRALVHGRADAPRVTAAQIGETERRSRALERARARALKRSRKAKR